MHIVFTQIWHINHKVGLWVANIECVVVFHLSGKGLEETIFEMICNGMATPTVNAVDLE